MGNELNAVHKPWNSADVRFCLSYPETYEVGASNLGHLILYSVLNAEPRLLCDRSYMPADDMQSLLKVSAPVLQSKPQQQHLVGLELAPTTLFAALVPKRTYFCANVELRREGWGIAT